MIEVLPVRSVEVDDVVSVSLESALVSGCGCSAIFRFGRQKLF
jgi:hypothetical protein